jgi:Cu2+-exporting ATPase
VGQGKWHVETNNPEKILSVEIENVSEFEIEDAIKGLGFKIAIVDN